MKKQHWSICEKCKGQARVLQGPSKRLRRRYQKDLKHFQASKDKEDAPVKPNPKIDICNACDGSGLQKSGTITPVDINFPNVAIIGGGIGGTALAVACLHRGIPFTLYERDNNFQERSQGYGLTLQQASKAMQGLGIPNLKDGIISTRHIVQNSEGKIIGEWGMRKWLKNEPKKKNWT